MTMIERSRFGFAILLTSLLLSGAELRADGPPRQGGAEPIRITVQVGGYTAKILIQSLKQCVTLTQIGEPPELRASTPEDGTPPAPASNASSASEKSNSTQAVPVNVPNPAEDGSKGEVVDISSEVNPLEGPSPSPILATDRPDWVGRTFHEVDSKHFVSVGGFPDVTFEKSLASLDEAILREARKYVDEHILQTEGGAEQLERLDIDWIKANWLVADKVFDSKFESSSSTYHQAWMELVIDESDRRLVDHWWKEIVRQERAKSLGGSMAAGVAGIAILHLLFGFVVARNRKPSNE